MLGWYEAPPQQLVTDIIYLSTSVSKKYFDERIDDLKQLIENIRRENVALKKENTDLKSAIVAVKDQCLRTELSLNARIFLSMGYPTRKMKTLKKLLMIFYQKCRYGTTGILSLRPSIDLEVRLNVPSDKFASGIGPYSCICFKSST